MNLYCISIFLKQEAIDKILLNCRREKIKYKEIEVTDQVNEEVIGYQANISGLKILILPCNDFHKDKDFEIGITEENHKSWNDFIEKAKSNFESKNEYGKFTDGETEYFLIKDEKYHGNFFFIFDGQKSEEEPLVKIECTMTKYDFDFYKNKIENLIGENLCSKLNITVADTFSLNRFIVKNAGTSIVLEV